MAASPDVWLGRVRCSQHRGPGSTVSRGTPTGNTARAIAVGRLGKCEPGEGNAGVGAGVVERGNRNLLAAAPFAGNRAARGQGPTRIMTVPATTRDFTVAVFVVHVGRVILHRHRKLGIWLPPGGHIEPNELPDEA